MSELTFEQMLEESFKTIHSGEVVEGTVIDVKPDEIILNIGYKSDGILTRSEYTNESNLDLTTVAKVGDTMEVKVIKVNDSEGQVLLSYKRLAAEKGNKRIEDAFNNQEVLKAKVTQVLEGGVCVVVDEVRIFIPASLVSDTYEKDLSKYEGQEIEFVVTEYNPRKRRYIGNRRMLLSAEREKAQKELFDRINVGDVVVSTDAVYHDFAVGAFGYPRGQVPGHDGIGFVSDPELRGRIIEAIKVTAPEIGVHEGRVASGDQFIASRDVKNDIRDTFGALCTEMEGCAIAHTAERNGIPCVIVRYISDNADDSATMDYAAFEKQAAHNSANILFSVIHSFE